MSQSESIRARKQGGAISGVRVGTPIIVPDNFGDTWVTAWADDDRLYTPCNDTLGFGIPKFLTEERIRLFQSDFKTFAKEMTPAEEKAWNERLSLITITRVEGNDPRSLRGSTVNPMHDYCKYDRFVSIAGVGAESLALVSEKSPDGRYWKSSGCTFVDGALYWVVARHMYPDREDVQSVRQHAMHGSLIRSTDYGRTWTRTAEENATAPMFPESQFATPYFVDYGKTRPNVDGADRYVYAISNNGYWDNGDSMILGRVERGRIADLNGKDWEFFAGGDGTNHSNWTRDAGQASPLMEGNRQIGSTGATYLPARGRYLLIGWYYPNGGGHFKGSSKTTEWNFFESEKPWGPWRRIASHTWTPQGYYVPNVCAKFQTADRVYVTTAGDFRNWWDHYRLTLVPVDLV